MANDDLPADEKKMIQLKLLELSKKLISNELEYSKNLQKTQGLVVKMEKTVLAQDSLNSLVQQTLDDFEETKENQFRERIFFLIFGLLLVILAIVFYVFGRKNYQQNKKISAQKEEIEQQNIRLEDTLHNLQETQGQLVQSERMASLWILTASVAHEINNPINYVSGGIQNTKIILGELWEILDKYTDLENAETLEKIKLAKNAVQELRQELEFDDEYKEITYGTLDDMRTGTQRIIKVVKSLQAFTRLDENGIKEFDIHENLEAVLVLLGNRFMGKIQLVKELAENLSPVICSPAKINQVLLNLLTNAEDALEGAGKITIKTYENEDFAIISIRDDGAGIPPEIQGNIFKPMFSTKKTGTSSGLGLTIAKQIMDEHQGKIEFDSVVGQGTEFRMYLSKSIKY